MRLKTLVDAGYDPVAVLEVVELPPMGHNKPVQLEQRTICPTLLFLLLPLRMENQMTKWYEITNRLMPLLPSISMMRWVGTAFRHNFMNELNAIKSDKLDVHINSVGGEVFQGFRYLPGIEGTSR